MSTLRLFVCLYPPRDVAESLLSALAGQSLPEHRQVAAEQVHLTLHFIGEIDSRQLDEVRESVERSASGLECFSLAITSLISLPERGETRLVAARCASHSTLEELHRRLVHRLARKKQGREDFLPHMTLVRLRVPTRMERVELPLDRVEFPVRAIHLVQSHLQTGGAVHRTVAEFGLR